MYVCRREAERNKEEKKERHETEWRHRINLPGRKLPHKYNREGKASWWSAGIARRTVTDSAHRTGRGNLRGGRVRWVDVSEAKRWLCGVGKGGNGGRLLSLSLFITRNTRRRETWRNGTNDRWDSALLRAWHGYIPPPFSSYGSEKPPLWQARYAAWWAHRTWYPVRSFKHEFVDGALHVWPTTPSHSKLANIVDIKNRMIKNPVSRQKRKMLYDHEINYPRQHMSLKDDSKTI